jgi:hypothetical protein
MVRQRRRRRQFSGSSVMQLSWSNRWFFVVKRPGMRRRRGAQQIPPVAALILAGLGTGHSAEQRQISLVDVQLLNPAGWRPRASPGLRPGAP